MTWKGIGSLSYQGAGRAQQAQGPSLKLRAEPLPGQDSLSTSGHAAQLHPDDFQVFAEYLQGAPAFLQHASGSDCLVAAEPCEATTKGTVQMDSVARHNLRIVTKEAYVLSVWAGPDSIEHLDLKEVVLEVRALHTSGLVAEPSQCANVCQRREDDDMAQGAYDDQADSDALTSDGEQRGVHSCLQLCAHHDCSANVHSGPAVLGLQLSPHGPCQSCWRNHAGVDVVNVNARELVKLLVQSHASRMLAVNQAVTATSGGTTFAMRVSAADYLDADARAETIGYHSFRGRLVPDTDIYLTAAATTEDNSSMHSYFALHRVRCHCCVSVKG